MSTTYELLDVPSAELDIEIALRPVVTERPQVISATPGYTSGGAYNFSNIQVVFDKDMDENSIYYDTKEIGNLIEQYQLQNRDFLPEIDPDKPDEKHYGYVIRDENDEIVDIFYKNIQIRDNKDVTKNLLEHFDAPYFENPKLLVIPPKENNYPIGGTTLLVTLDKSFSTFEQGKSVGLRETKKWIYYVNSKKDEDEPEITRIKILSKQKEELVSNSSQITYLDSEGFLYISLYAVDEGAGLTGKIMMVFDEDAGFTAHESIPVYYTFKEGYYASLGTGNENSYLYFRFNPKDPKNNFHAGEDYKYKFHFECEDASPNHNRHIDDRHYSFSIDMQAPNMKTVTQDTLKFTPPTTMQLDFKARDTGFGYKNCKIYYRQRNPDYSYSSGWFYNYSDTPYHSVTEVTSTTSENPDEDGFYSETATITGLKSGRTYEILVRLFDKAGNTRDYYFKKNTTPVPLTETDVQNYVYEVDEVARGIRIYPRNYNSQQISGARVILTKTSVEPNESTEVDAFSINGEEGIFVGGIDYGSTYSITATKCSMTDYFNTAENPDDFYYENRDCVYEPLEVDFSDNPVQMRTDIRTKPRGLSSVNIVENTYDSDRGVSKVTFSFTKPEGATGVKVYFQRYSGGTVNYSNSLSSMNTLEDNVTINALSPGARYNFKFETYNYYSSNTCTEGNVLYMDVVTAAAPDPVIPDTVAPAKNLSVTTQERSAVLTWTKPVSYTDDSYYLVEWKKSGETKQSCKVDINQESFAIAGLQSNVYYDFYVSVCRGNKKSSDVSTYKRTLQYTFIPEDISVTWNFSNTSVSGSSAVNISASKNSNTTVYLWYSTNYNSLIQGYSSCYKVEITSNSISKQISNLNSNQTYYFVFKSSNKENDTTRCSEIIALTTSPSSNSSKYPTNLKAQMDGNTNTVLLSWTRPSLTNKYNVSYKKYSDSNWNTISGTYATSCSIENLERGEMYLFKLVDSDNTSYYSVIGRTIPCLAPTYESTNPFTSFTQTDCSTNTITMSWKLQNGFVWDSIKIYRGNTLIADDIPPAITSITEGGFESGSYFAPYTATDRYRIVACKGSLLYNSDCSQYVGTQNPEPSNLQLDSSYGGNGINNSTSPKSNFIALKWDHATTHTNGYMIRYRKSDSSQWYYYTTGSNSYKIQSNLESGTEYVIEVMTRGYGNSNMLNSLPCTMTQRTKVIPVTCNVSSSQSTANTISVAWNNPESFTKIDLQYKKSSDAEWIDALTVKSTDTSKPESYKFKFLEPSTSYDFRWIVYCDYEMKIHSDLDEKITFSTTSN